MLPIKFLLYEDLRATLMRSHDPRVSEPIRPKSSVPEMVHIFGDVPHTHNIVEQHYTLS